MTRTNRRSVLRSIAAGGATISLASVSEAAETASDRPERRDIAIHNNSDTTQRMTVEIVRDDQVLFRNSWELRGLNDSAVENPEETQFSGDLQVRAEPGTYLVRAEVGDQSDSIEVPVSVEGFPSAYGVSFYVTHTGRVRAHAGWV